MSPDQINAKHGNPSWRCNTCGASSGLMWWNGLSVAICSRNPACSHVESDKFRQEAEEAEHRAKWEAEWLGE